jgi:serine/threonine protein phosphatase PrpC
VRRLFDEVEFDDRLAEGLCVVARKFEKSTSPLACEIAIMGRPYPGEIISGDDAAFVQSESGFLAVVADGLGHGPEAREASRNAVEALVRTAESDLSHVIFRVNEELSSTRGCAMSLVRFDRASRTLECVSLGDVHSHVYNFRDAHFFTSTPFILGSSFHKSPNVRVETAVVERGSVLVMFTDGLKSRTTLKGELDVLRQPPIGVAQHLLEHNSRPDDDALVLVARFLR